MANYMVINVERQININANYMVDYMVINVEN